MQPGDAVAEHCSAPPEHDDVTARKDTDLPTYRKREKVLQLLSVDTSKVRIGILNQKGGVGKTTSTLNLGAALATAGKRVALIDADPAAGLTYAVRFRPSEIPEEASTAALFMGQVVSPQPLARNLGLVPSSPAAMVSLERSWNASGVTINLAGFDRLLVDLVLLDAPPNLGALSAAVIRLSTVLLIPMIPEPAFIGVIETLLATIEAVNPQAEILGVIPTLYDGRRKLTEEVLNHIRKQFPRLPILTPVPRLLTLAETPLHGRSVIESAPRSSTAEAYRTIAEEINRVPSHA